MALEDVLKSLGKFGKYQIITYCLVGLSFGLTAQWQLFAIVFIGYINPHHCSKRNNLTLDESVPIDPDTGMHSSCSMYVNRSIDNSTTACDVGWTYSLDGFDPQGTITMEWDLICEKDWWVELSQTLFNVGVVSGFFFFTPFGDKFGRKKLFFICQLLMSVFGVIMAFSVNFEMFCAFQFLTGACAAGLFLSGLVLACEMFPTSMRATIAPATVMFVSLGMVTLTLWAYLIRNWRWLQLGVSIAGFCSLIYVFWCPESMRWLLANGREEEAIKILKTAAKVNGCELPDDMDFSDDLPEVKSKEEKEKETPLLWQYLKNKRTLRFMLIMMYIVLVNNFMYYGLSLMMGAIGGDLYLNFFINAVVEIPAVAFAIWCMYMVGRRWPLCIFQIFSAVAMAAASFCSVYEFEGVDQGWLLTGMAFVTKFGVGATYGVSLIYAQEIFPTNLRSTGLGLTAGAGFAGSILAPYSVYLYRQMRWVPTAVFAILSLIAGLLTLLEPETAGRDLPQTVEEVSNWTLALTKEEKDKIKDKKAEKKLAKSNKVETWAEKEREANGVPTISNGVQNPGFSSSQQDMTKL